MGDVQRLRGICRDGWLDPDTLPIGVADRVHWPPERNAQHELGRDRLETIVVRGSGGLGADQLAEVELLDVVGESLCSRARRIVDEHIERLAAQPAGRKIFESPRLRGWFAGFQKGQFERSRFEEVADEVSHRSMRTAAVAA